MAQLGDYLLYSARASFRSSDPPPPGGLETDFQSDGDGDEEGVDNQEANRYAKDGAENLA